MRTDSVARYSKDRGLIPRLGFFAGHEAQLPYDWDDVLSLIAPRPVMVVEPQLDRDASPMDVHSAVEQARKVYTLYGASEKLALEEPWDYNRLPEKTQDQIVKWMGASLH